jgi:hypothetical protein
MLLSHSPPHERIDFYLGQFWNDLRVKMVTQPSLEEIIANPLAHQSTKPSIQNYPFSVSRWEEELHLRAKGKVAEDGSQNEGHFSQLPSGVIEFEANRAFLYILSK